MTDTFKIVEKIRAAEEAFLDQRNSISADFADDYPMIQRAVYNENFVAVGGSENRNGWRVRLRYIFQILRYELFDRQRAKMTIHQTVFLTPSTGRRFKGATGWYDATVEAIANDDVSGNSFCYEVPAFGTYRDRKARPSFYLGLPEVFYRGMSKFFVARRPVPNALLQDVARFKTLVEAQGLTARTLEVGAFARAYRYLHDRSDVFETQLRKMQCKVVVTYPWYGQINMAMMLAANRLGLRTIDCQHGVQGPLHAAYSRWPAFCLDSLLFPQQFFVWTEGDKEWLDTWIGPNRVAEVTGIPWHNVSQEKIGENAQQQAYERALAAHDRNGVILVSLQPNRPEFIVWLSEILMQPEAKNYTWVVRNHPGNQNQLGALSELLDPFEMVLPVDVSSNAPLIGQLRSCDLHITDYSSVVTEASLVGMNSLMLTQREDLYAQERRLGFAHSIVSGPAFWADVERLKAPKQQ